MRQASSGCLGIRRVGFLLLFAMACTACFGARPSPAQTQQPYLFATTQVGSNPGVAVFQRNDATGALNEVPGSAFTLLTSNCYPATMEPKGRYLLGSCGDGISLYQFDSATGVVSEVPNSPFAASTGGAPDAVIAESTGQFAYALRITHTAYPAPSTVTLDSFVIDAAQNVLDQPSTQTFPLAGTYLGLVVDPNGHFVRILFSVPTGESPPAQGSSCGIFFDPQTGLPINSTSGFCQFGLTAGDAPLGIAIAARGNYLGTGANGQIFPNLSVVAISPSNGSVQASGIFQFTETNDDIDTPFFDPSGQLIYVSSQLTGFRVFSLSVVSGGVAFSELPSSPLPSTLDRTPLYALPDPAAEFTFIGGSNVITTYPIDTATGLPGTPLTNSLTHNPPLNLQPIYATMPPPGQAVSAPAISLSTPSLSFGPINPGQTGGPSLVTVSSTGNEALTISAIAISPIAGPFSEIDTCLSNPVLAPGTSCQVSVSYSPNAVGMTQASLMISDNAPGSPHSVSLSGTAVAPPPPAPEVTLLPGTLNFPGMTTQGESSAPQSISITNSGNATLTFTAPPSISGVNTTDFSISSNTCTGPLAANASCTVNVIFSPLAAGVRTTNLMIGDNAANSPQSVTINGSAAAAATFASPSGSSASVSAGQPATYMLQATPGAGFSGTLSFACSGAPTAATCSAPSITVVNGSSTNFSVIVTTSGNAMLTPVSTPQIHPGTKGFRPIAPWIPMSLVLLLWMVASRRLVAGRRSRRFAPATLCFASLLAGCGGGGSSSQIQQTVTPAGTYTLTVTPTATPSGSSKNYTLNPIALTLKVN